MSEKKKQPTSRERAYSIVYNDGDAYRSGANGGEPLVAAIESAINEAVEADREANKDPWELVVGFGLICALIGLLPGALIGQYDADRRAEFNRSLCKTDVAIAKSEAERAQRDARECNDRIATPWEWNWVDDNMLATTDTISGGPWQLVGNVVNGCGKPVSIYRIGRR